MFSTPLICSSIGVGDGVGQGLGRGAGIGGGDGHRGRGDLADTAPTGRVGKAIAPTRVIRIATHGREHRPVDEEVGELHRVGELSCRRDRGGRWRRGAV